MKFKLFLLFCFLLSAGIIITVVMPRIRIRNRDLYPGSVKTRNLIYRDEDRAKVLDGKGLVSLVSFLNDYVSYPAVSQTTTSDTVVDVTNSTLDSFTLDRETEVLIFMTAYAQNDAADSSTSNETAIYVTDATTGDQLMLTNVSGSPITGGAVHNTSVSNIIIQSLAEGSHQLKLQFHRNSAGTAKIFSFSLGYVILGK